MIWVVVKIVLEIALACHCDAWSTTPSGPRCIAPRDYPRCEFFDGWHAAAFGVFVCSRGNCD